MLLGTLATACFLAATALLVRLHTLPTELRPTRDAVSDYGTTPYHRYYRAMVVALGAGAALLAVGLARDTDAGSLVWLWIYAGSRIAIAAFMTDRAPPPFTTRGRIHLLLAAAAFAAIAVAATSIDWHGRPGVLSPLGQAVAATAIGTLVSRAVPQLRSAFGFVERLLYATSIAWLLIAAIDLAGGG
jgi:uncharacterized protein DUF998